MDEMTGWHTAVILTVIALPLVAVAAVTWLIVHLTKNRGAPPRDPSPRGD